MISNILKQFLHFYVLERGNTMLYSLILAIPDPLKREMVMDLFNNYRKKGLAAAFQIVKNHHTAEDKVQEVFYAIARNPDKLKYATADKNWPYVEVMIRNRCKNYVRDTKKEQLVDDFSKFEPQAQAYQAKMDIAEWLAVKERFMQAIDALLALPDVYKDALLLRYDNNLSNKEISEVLGIPDSTVRVRIHRALAILQKELAGGENNAGA
jgi:RNA polymerase sigma-70 factor (ECF subfamily)